MKADMYSIGALLFSLVTGTSPPASISDPSFMSRLDAVRATVPKDVLTAIVALMSDCPEDRPAVDDVRQVMCEGCRTLLS